MVQEKKEPSIKLLPAFCSVWIALFVVFELLAPRFETIDRSISTFLSATILTLASILVVSSFSRLVLDRKKYLLIGAISLIAVFLTATPFVKRSEFINSSGEILGQTVFLALQTQTLSINCTPILMPLRNAVFKTNTDFVGNLLPENTWLIILLSLAQLGLASGIGLWIAEGIDDITHLIPVALIATMADIWSVSAGVTAKIVVSSSINYFLLRFPVLGTSSIPFLIGLTDFLFFAILLFPADVVISEFATRGTSSAYDEFVELYNTTCGDVDISGWTLEYFSGLTWGTKVTVPASTTLQSGQFYLIASRNDYYVSPGSGPEADLYHTTYLGFADGTSGNARGVRIKNSGGTVIDTVMYEANGNTAHAEAEGGLTAPNHGTTANGNSVERKAFSNSTENDLASGGAHEFDGNAYDLSLIHISEPTRPY